MEKYKVGVIGGTGMVGQRFVTLMENHPWFQLTAIAASPRSAGKTYEEAVAHRWAMKTPIPAEAKDIVVMDAAADVEKIAGDGLVLLLQFLTDGSNPMNRLADAVMDVPIRDALGQFCQLLCPLALQLRGHAVLCDPVQQPFNVGGGPGVASTFVAVVMFRAAALRCGNLTGIMQRNTATLLIRHLLMLLG